ncbi:MAG TPA: hypoxanthine phosphoribosyltransferase [Chthonomonadales bacterium]|nr:hypoxanthine phosphoribosyltransferase [Chthonomonadales bacterium]
MTGPGSSGARLDALISADAIAARVARLGDQIGVDYQGCDLVVVGVLTGAVVFLADLVRRIPLPMEIDFVATSSYGAATAATGEVRLLKDLSHPIDGKHVLLVEDIVDTGLTLRYLVGLLRSRGPASVRTCALLDKPARRRVDQHADYVGFAIEDRFVVGYGLDLAGLYRNLPYIGVLKPDGPAA